VLVHGAWHGPWCWQGVVDALEAQGVDVHAVELPLTSYDDVAAARKAIKAAGKGAVVCGHSYGGMVISRAASGLPIGRIVYLTAFMTDEGEPPMDHMQAHPSPMMAAIRTDGGVLTVDPAMLHEAFYEDSDPDVVVEIEKLLRPMPLGDTCVLDVEPAWRQVPSTYIVCTNDKAISEGRATRDGRARRRGGRVGHRPLTVPHSAGRHRGPSGQARVTGGRGGDPIALRRASSTRSRR